ncbi:UDP-N-acetylmuramate dehydrogenase [Azospirillum sp. RWY-5-1]|uniref:UDP-N-acetylenolpyruvoylglucosamine reductase n=1 Tax=Azospirillum oleiclasticum TaxID=2735135 RepID=A0ABX2TFS5_9PROT|nr:UDP-N-acetylmuramate dehydrogenase [Azospirillum oleiclasticum]NYZ15723.1 UDP-N-acetylmuramate dehydrogenase [Azospirillum oleiclasticum]NYZ21993.1 UDP-N-acetylmuramate dehydrogenase [Azospirillum oleiclasticum]
MTALSAMTEPHLIDVMPRVRGRLTADAPLAPVTWFRVGGPAEVMFRPADAEDLAVFLDALPDEVPVTVIGVASNLLVRDGGVPGVVIRLGRGFADIDAAGTDVTAGAAALDLNVAAVARDAGIGGLEFLSGIPGTIGGALRMNGGAYGREMRDVLIAAQGVDRRGARLTFTAAEMGFTYRHSAVPDDVIFTGALLRGTREDPAVIGARMDDIAAKRADTQPVRARTGGSTFKNPPGRKAWELIDAAGCRGLTVGVAQVSEKHCNFLLNLGGATAADLETLGEEVRRRVFDRFGIMLEWEIKRIGLAKGDAR